MSPARKPPPAAVDGSLIAIDRWCPNCGAPPGKRCIDTRKRSRPAAKITHLARGWLDLECRHGTSSTQETANARLLSLPL